MAIALGRALESQRIQVLKSRYALLMNTCFVVDVCEWRYEWEKKRETDSR